MGVPDRAGRRRRRAGAQRRDRRGHRGLRRGAAARPVPGGAARRSAAGRAHPRADLPRRSRPSRCATSSSRRRRSRGSGASRSRPISPPARAARRRSSTRRTAATATPSPTAPTAGRASPSRATCPTTAPRRRWRRSAMCPECAREYEDPLDRRFHAQPNACPACGPRLSAGGREGPAGRRAIRSPRRCARCGTGASWRSRASAGSTSPATPTSPQAVRRLRERKRREEKPFAVMVARPRRRRDAARRAARRRGGAARLGRAADRAGAPARGRRARRRGRAREPAASGCMLAYTPLHHLLLAGVGGPLVMTSGNLSEEPMACARRRGARAARGIADLFLRPRPRDRDPLRRLGGAGDRRARRWCCGARAATCRGRSPLRTRVARPVLACGADLKNTFCVASGDSALLGPHIGDLDNLETCAVDRASRSTRMQRFLRRRAGGGRPRPPSRLRRDARTRARRSEPCVAVQHHHAHVASAMAEHGIEGPVIGARLRRHRLWHRRHGLGRRAAAGDGVGLPAARDAAADAAAPAARRRSGRCGASRSPRSTTRSSGVPPLERASAVRVRAGARHRRRAAASSRAASTRRSRTGRGAGSTRSAPSASRAARPPTRARWRWSGKPRRRRAAAPCTDSPSTPRATRSSSTCGRWSAPRRRT